MKTLKFHKIKQLPKIMKLDSDKFCGERRARRVVRVQQRTKEGGETVNPILAGEMKQ